MVSSPLFDLMKLIDALPSTARSHVNRLERAGLIETLPGSRRMRECKLTAAVQVSEKELRLSEPGGSLVVRLRQPGRE
jgi:DNA-binding MarR family transcriptional regulator